MRWTQPDIHVLCRPQKCSDTKDPKGKHRLYQKRLGACMCHEMLNTYCTIYARHMQFPLYCYVTAELIYILYACSIIRYLYLFMHRRMYIHITSCVYIHIYLCVCVWWTNLRQYIWNNDWIFCFRFCDVTQAHYTYQHYTKWTRNTYTITYIL